MRQAIVTKYLGPTNFRGARVKATAEAGSVTVVWDDALGADENHTTAARTLATQLRWGGQWAAGGLPSKDGNCYVHLAYPVLDRDWPDNAPDTFFVRSDA